VFSLTDKKLSMKIIEKIKKKNMPMKLMHVCGTHQDTLMKHGLDSLLQKCQIEIIQGPGCPVCVTTPREIEEMILLAKKDKIITTYGDMIQVPGQKNSLQYMRTEGCDIRTVYSIEDAVEIAEKHNDKEVVFMAVGFETTAPTTAAVIKNNPVDNFTILCCHRTIPNALKALLEMGEIQIDGFIDPGHVSTIIGTKPYEILSEKYNISQVIAGFEPIDILMAAYFLVQQKEKNQAIVQNEYTRAVTQEGNIKAQKIINEVFEPCDIAWRGFPVIPKSGLKLKSKYKKHDARIQFKEILSELDNQEFKEPAGCRCGDLLRGLITPNDCPLFGKQCKPENPIGPCMVSIEGSCNITFKYKTKI
jgi:hydrogenase expression/formation protein HypD